MIVISCNNAIQAGIGVEDSTGHPRGFASPHNIRQVEENPHLACVFRSFLILTFWCKCEEPQHNNMQMYANQIRSSTPLEEGLCSFILFSRILST